MSSLLGKKKKKRKTSIQSAALFHDFHQIPLEPGGAGGWGMGWAELLRGGSQDVLKVTAQMGSRSDTK